MTSRAIAVPARGFTLLELLVVIAVLAGLLLVGAATLRKGAKRTQTGSTINALRLALAVQGAQRGARADAAEHPLAGSAEPRARFVRVAGGAVQGTGEALIAESLAIVAPSAQPRVLLPDDRYAGYATDGDVPFLYGLARDRIGVIGPAPAALTRYRRLPSRHDAAGAVRPADGFDANGDGVLDGAPYTDGGTPAYPDGRFLTAPLATDWEGESRRVVDYVLGAGASAEVVQSKGIVTTTSPADGTLAADDRVVVLTGSGAAAWQPGCLRIAGTWKRYRLRGTAVVDAWGQEILYVNSSSGGVRLVSAGPDGVVRWHPGEDGVFQTQPRDAAPAGDDRDGAIDNITAMTGDGG